MEWNLMEFNLIFFTLDRPACPARHYKFKMATLLLNMSITQLPLPHRPQYKTEWMFEFIKTLNNFGLPKVLHVETFRKKC